jgi:hypothetical protein
MLHGVPTVSALTTLLLGGSLAIGIAAARLEPSAVAAQADHYPNNCRTEFVGSEGRTCVTILNESRRGELILSDTVLDAVLVKPPDRILPGESGEWVTLWPVQIGYISYYWDAGDGAEIEIRYDLDYRNGNISVTPLREAPAFHCRITSRVVPYSWGPVITVNDVAFEGATRGGCTLSVPSPWAGDGSAAGSATLTTTPGGATPTSGTPAAQTPAAVGATGTPGA